jgi:hypothetical protein
MATRGLFFAASRERRILNSFFDKAHYLAIRLDIS